MNEETKLETVADVLEWALQQLGVEGLCNDGCVCDSPECCDIPAGCLLATTRRCVPKESDHHCSICESNDSTGGDGICYVPTPVKVPKNPGWSSEPPTEPGWYASWWPESKSPRLDRISLSGGEIRIGDFSLTEVCYLDGIDEDKIQWLKIAEPELPPKE